MKPFDVVFFVEHVDRELESLKRIASALGGRYGIRSVILSTFFHPQLLLSRYAGRVFAVPFASHADDWPLRLPREMYGQRSMYVNLNWEQLLSEANRQYKRPKDDFVRGVMRHTAWDEAFRDYLVQHGVSPSNVSVVGNPELALLREKIAERGSWRRLFADQYDLDPSKRWVFFPVNHGWAFDSPFHVQSRIRAGFEEKVAIEYLSFARASLKAFLEWTAEAARVYPRFHFIVRPHPSVPTEAYARAFQETVGRIPSNVLIAKSHTASEWVAAADMVVSSWSTVAWYAHCAGRPVYLLSPYERPNMLQVDWYSRVPELRSKQEFLNVLNGTAAPPGPVGRDGGAQVFEAYAAFFADLSRSAPSGLQATRDRPSLTSWIRMGRAIQRNASHAFLPREGRVGADRFAPLEFG